MRSTVPTEHEVFRREVSEDITVTAHVGYGRSVSFEISTETLSVDLGLEPGRARQVAVALMDAATAAETK
jgi:hypothetical protein